MTRREDPALAGCELQNVRVLWPVSIEDTVPVGRHVYIEITRRCKVISGKDATPGNDVPYLHCHLGFCNSFYEGKVLAVWCKYGCVLLGGCLECVQHMLCQLPCGPIPYEHSFTGRSGICKEADVVAI